MNIYLQTDPWCIVEDGFNAEKQIESEDIFSLANSHIALRGNFEENYSGETLLGTNIAGICYHQSGITQQAENKFIANDRFLNAPDWNKIIVRLNDEMIDLATWEIESFKRVLNMREGYLERTFEATSPKSHRIQVSIKRFLSMAEPEIEAISYSVKSVNFEGRISFMPVIDGDIKNADSLDNEQLWNILQIRTQQEVSHLWAHARRMDFHFCGALTYVLYKNNEQLKVNPTKIEKERIAGFSVGADVKPGDTVCLNKYIAIIDSLSYLNKDYAGYACLVAINAKKKGWNKLFEEHTAVWTEKWLQFEDDIEDDIDSQQKKYVEYFKNTTNINQKLSSTIKV